MSTDDRRPSTRPAALPSAVPAGTVLALLLLVLAGLAIRDLAVRAGWLDGDEWLRGATHWGTGVGWQTWMWPVAVLVILIGLVLLWSAVRPRRHDYVGYGDSSGDGVIWTRPRDIARRCSAAAGALPGVDGAVTHYGRRRVTVTVAGEAAAIDTAAVTQAVEGVVDRFGGRTVRVKHARGRAGEPQ